MNAYQFGQIAAAVAPAATTGAAGAALQNATSTLLSWTAPDDGQLRAVSLAAVLDVTVAESGGALALASTASGSIPATSQTVNAGGGAIGTYVASTSSVVVGPGATVTLSQTSALTAGAATVFAVILAS